VVKLSSAHVYLRMDKGQTMEMISPELLEDCAQLVKANSIQGRLLASYFGVIYVLIRTAFTLSIIIWKMLIVERVAIFV